MSRSYLAENQSTVEAAITAAIGAAVKARARDPIAFVAQCLAKGSRAQPNLDSVDVHGKNGAEDVWTVQRRAAMDDAEYLSWQGEKMARAFGHALRAVLNERAADPLQSFSRHAVQFVEEPEVKQTTIRDESDAVSAARAKAKVK